METKRKKKKNRFILWLVLTIVFSFMVGVGVWAVDFVNDIKNPDWSVSNSPSASVPGVSLAPGQSQYDEVKPSQDQNYDKLEFGKDVLNILVMGYDSNEYREDSGFVVYRTDALILCTVYFNENKVVMTSVPRDSYVPIGPDFVRKDKINSAFSSAQTARIDPYQATCKTVSRLFGNVPIDYYISIDMDVFADAIDALGGIEYDVDVEVAYNGKVLVPMGKKVLNGWEALQYVTFRKTQNGDIDRVARQRKFIMAAFSQLKSFDKIMKLPEIYSMLMDRMSTNLTYKQIMSLAVFAMNDLDSESISGSTFPGSFLTMNGVSYWNINQRERVLLVHKLFHVTIQPDEQD